MRISGMLRIYWNINTPIKLKSGQSIPLGKYKYLLIRFYKIESHRFVSQIIGCL
jgi:hypothetical protein